MRGRTLTIDADGVKGEQRRHRGKLMKKYALGLILLYFLPPHQKQYHVPYSLAILINGIVLLICGIASMLWAFQYVFSCI